MADTMDGMQTYEVEVKSLLGEEERAQELRQKMFDLDPATRLTSRNKQLNHYFHGGNLEALAATVAGRLSDMARTRLSDLAAKATQFSVRTRQFDKLTASDKAGATLLVVKASVDDTTSENGITRIEFEESVDIPLGALDALVLGSGFDYQAKWSREREEYLCRNIGVCLDKNAGYGWLAEFEKMVERIEELEHARHEVRGLMRELGVEELPQERLERMFRFYNEHWPEYYGTDKTFTVA